MRDGAALLGVLEHLVDAHEGIGMTSSAIGVASCRNGSRAA